MKFTMVRALKELSNALFRGVVAILVPELYAYMQKQNVEKKTNLTFDDP